MRLADYARSQPGLTGALFVDALGTGLFLPLSLLFFEKTTSLSLTQIGLGLSAAALVRIPVTIVAGPLSDRFGPRTAVVGSQLLQAAGFAGYLFVHGVWQLVAAAALVQVGNSVFWVAYSPLIFSVAAGGEREQWFALATALRTAGLAAGGAIAGATMAVGGRAGYQAVVAANAASFVLAAALVTGRRRSRSRAPAPARNSAPAGNSGESAGAGQAAGWGALLRDRPFLVFVSVNLGLTLLALAPQLALPVFLVKTLKLPAWSPGTALALTAILVTVSTPAVMSAIAGRRRHRVLMASQALMALAAVLFLLLEALPAAAAVALALAAIVPLALCEVMQAGVVPAVVTESATPATVGRYVSAYQVTFSVGDIIVPVVVTTALKAGAAALWLPMAALALADLAAVGFLAPRMPALTRRVGEPPPEQDSAERLLEADGL